MKKLMSLLLVICMCITLVPQVFAADVSNTDEIYEAAEDPYEQMTLEVDSESIAQIPANMTIVSGIEYTIPLFAEASDEVISLHAELDLPDGDFSSVKVEKADKSANFQFDYKYKNGVLKIGVIGTDDILGSTGENGELLNIIVMPDTENTQYEITLHDVSFNGAPVATVMSGTAEFKPGYAITAKVNYYAGDNIGVKDVTISAAGVEKITDETGSVSFKVAEQNVTIMAMCNNLVNAVSAFDASLVLQSSVGNITLTDHQMLAADVDGSGTANEYDAALILQKAVRKISTFPADDVWVFVPSFVEATLNTTEDTVVSFTAILIGDVDGSYKGNEEYEDVPDSGDSTTGDPTTGGDDNTGSGDDNTGSGDDVGGDDNTGSGDDTGDDENTGSEDDDVIVSTGKYLFIIELIESADEDNFQIKAILENDEIGVFTVKANDEKNLTIIRESGEIEELGLVLENLAVGGTYKYTENSKGQITALEFYIEEPEHDQSGINKIELMEGVVTSIDNYDWAGDNAVGEGYIRVTDADFADEDFDENDAYIWEYDLDKSYLGKEVKVWYKPDAVSPHGDMVFAITEAKKSTSMTLPHIVLKGSLADDDDNEITFALNDVDYTAKLDYNCVFVENNEYLGDMNGLFGEDMTAKQFYPATLRMWLPVMYNFIDNDADGKYEFVVRQVYGFSEVTGLTSSRISLEEEGSIDRKNDNGKAYDWNVGLEDVAEEDWVVYYCDGAVSKDASVFAIMQGPDFDSDLYEDTEYATFAKMDFATLAVEDIIDHDRYVFDGTTYRTWSGFNTYYTDLVVGDDIEAEIGDEYELWYTNSFGGIIASAESVDASTGKFLVIIEMDDEEMFGGDFEIKAVLEDGEDDIFTVKADDEENLTINEDSEEVDEIPLMLENLVVGGLYEYKMNSNGKITALDFYAEVDTYVTGPEADFDALCATDINIDQDYEDYFKTKSGKLYGEDKSYVLADNAVVFVSEYIDGEWDDTTVYIGSFPKIKDADSVCVVGAKEKEVSGTWETKALHIIVTGDAALSSGSEDEDIAGYLRAVKRTGNADDGYWYEYTIAYGDNEAAVLKSRVADDTDDLEEVVEDDDIIDNDYWTKTMKKKASIILFDIAPDGTICEMEAVDEIGEEIFDTDGYSRENDDKKFFAAYFATAISNSKNRITVVPVYGDVLATARIKGDDVTVFLDEEEIFSVADDCTVFVFDMDSTNYAKVEIGSLGDIEKYDDDEGSLFSFAYDDEEGEITTIFVNGDTANAAEGTEDDYDYIVGEVTEATMIHDSLVDITDGSREDLERTYHYYLPTSYDPYEKMPLVINLHGMGSNSLGQISLTGFDEKAEEEGFIMVAPNSTYVAPDGTITSEGASTYDDPTLETQRITWNVGFSGFYSNALTKSSLYPDEPSVNIDVDDVGYISDLIDFCIEEFNADPDRVYVTGMSMGGIFSFRLAVELSDKIAAAAPVTGQLDNYVDIAGIDVADDITIIMTASVQDPVVTWEQAGPLGIIGAEATIDWWIDAYGIDESDCDVEVFDDEDKDDSKITRTEYAAGENGGKLITYIVEGTAEYPIGHTWPSGTQYLPAAVIGYTSQQLVATDYIWEAFSEVSK